MQNQYLFTSESVSEGHPDKIADQISDAILDAMLTQDRHARVACETFVKTGMVLVGGEVTTSAWVDIEQVTRNVIRDIGYNSSAIGFDWESCAVLSAIGKQSPDIAQGVNRQHAEEQGAGDQGRCGEVLGVEAEGESEVQEAEGRCVISVARKALARSPQAIGTDPPVRQRA